MRSSARGGEVCSRETFALPTDSGLIRLAAVRAGYELGAYQRALARRERLVQVQTDTHALNMETWLVMHEDLRADRHVCLVYDYLSKALAAVATGN